MELTLVSTGFWASVMVGGLLLVPVIIEFFKRNLPICLGLSVTLLTLCSLSPNNPAARAVWTPIYYTEDLLGRMLGSLIGIG